MKRDEVYARINDERDYVTERGMVEANPQPLCGWLALLGMYLDEARRQWTGKEPDAATTAGVLKVAALAVACLEQHGVGPVDRPGTNTECQKPVDAVIRGDESYEVREEEDV